MVEKLNQTEARQGTNKPPLTTILVVGLILCAIAGVILFFFAGATEPEGEAVGGAVQEIAPENLPEDRPTIDPTPDETIIEPETTQMD